MGTRTTIASLSKDIATEADAYRHLESLRWPGGVECPTCQGSDVYLITPKNGVSRKATNGTMTERRVWNCRACRKQFSAISGTFLHGTRVPVRTWCLVIFDMISAKNGISAREVERKYGVCPRTAWHMLHRIRGAMANRSRLLSGDVVADETYYGGTPKNRHWSQRKVDYDTGRGTEKAPVVALIEAETGEVRSAVVPNVTAATLFRVLRETTDMPMITLHTDAFRTYRNLAFLLRGHHYVDHSAGQYVSEKSLGTNKAEAFFSQFKRSVTGTHHHVSREHLHRYANEFAFRYSTCKLTEAERMRTLGGQLNGRLTYKEVKR